MHRRRPVTDLRPVIRPLNVNVWEMAANGVLEEEDLTPSFRVVDVDRLYAADEPARPSVQCEWHPYL